MKKNLLLCFSAILLFLEIARAQSPAYKGIYLDSFDGIVGNVAKEDSLLHYLQDSSFNSIICYRMSNVISSTLSSTKNTSLAKFLKRARTQFGIKNVLASSESYDTFLNLIGPYNRSRTDSTERFNYFYLEFEFWNVNSTSPVSSSHNGYYCTTYLSPKGYTCDTSGAFKYYKKMLKSIDSLATKDGIRSATYVGNPNKGQCRFIANTVDLLLCDNYTSSISTIYTDVKSLFSYFGSGSKTLQIVPIFASYSPGGNFLGDWLTKAPVGPHSEKGVYYNYFLPRYNAETGAWKSKLNLVGYQWYRYSGMPHNGNYSASGFCNPPSNLSSSLITSTSAKLSWSSISGGLGYVVQYRTINSSTWSSPIAVTGSSLSLTGLNPASNYEFQVKSSCISSTSTYSASALFSTLGTAGCSIATNLTASSITDIAALLSWSAVSGANSYSIQYRKVGAASWTTTTSSVSSKQLSSLTASSIYEFQVQTICANGTSGYSASFLFSTSAPVCNSPIGLSVSSITSNSATLKWTSISGVTGYNIQYRIVGTTNWQSTSSTSNSKSILALVENSNYEFQVQTKCSATNSSSFTSSYTFKTLTIACGAPSNVSATAATTSSFTISWTSNSAATNYIVQYKKSSASTWSSVTTSNLYKNISSLSTNTSYDYQVATVCASGTSAYSATGTISTSANTSSCGVPDGLFASNITLTSVTLNWLPITGANSYKVQYRKSGTTSWSSKTTSFTNKNITSLTSNTLYEFQVQTICSSGSSIYSAIGIFVTTPPAAAARMAAVLNSTPVTTAAKTVNTSPILSVTKTANTSINPKTIKAPNATFTIFPNPTDRENINLRIQLAHQETVKVQVIDMLGNTVFTENVLTDYYGFAEIKIRTMADLKVGIYQVMGYTSTSKLHCKLILK